MGPCCAPGQELGLWFPFNCRSEAGLLPGAKNAAHCQVGQAEGDNENIKKMSAQAVADWLKEQDLKKSYSLNWVTSRGLDGKALAEVKNVVVKSSVASGDDNSVKVAKHIRDVFDVDDAWGDAYKIMAALQDLS